MRTRITRRLAPIIIHQRRKGPPPVQPDHDQAAIRQAVIGESVTLSAQLHDEAARTVAAALARMAQQEQAAVRANPELAAALRAYFEASRQSLLENTLAILRDQPRPQSARSTSPRRVRVRLLMPRDRKEPHDGPA